MTSSAQLTTTERRSLQRLSTPGGHLMIVAADQRNSMKQVVQDAPGDPKNLSADDLLTLKSDLVRHLANQAPAILLDPEVAVPGVIDDGVLGRETALVVGLDASGYETETGLRYTHYVDGMTPAKARRMGADAVKMLWYLRPDKQDTDSRVGAEVRDLIAACAAEDILLIVEILVYQLDGESDTEYEATFPSLIADSARFAAACGAKVLKLQYPGSGEACDAVTAAASGAPWAVLSAGVDHETFTRQVAIATSHGAAGAMAGRSLWKDSLSYDTERREQLLTHRALPRLRELIATMDDTR